MTSSHSPHARFESLGLTLPAVGKPAGLYKPCLIVGTHAYLSGHLPMQADGTLIKGRIGQELDADAGKAAAGKGDGGEAGKVRPAGDEEVGG
jgi:hypothetical protein